MPRRKDCLLPFGLCPWCGLRPDKFEGPSPDQGHSPGIIWLLSAGHSHRLTSGGKAELTWPLTFGVKLRIRVICGFPS